MSILAAYCYYVQYYGKVIEMIHEPVPFALGNFISIFFCGSISAILYENIKQISLIQYLKGNKYFSFLGNSYSYVLFVFICVGNDIKSGENIYTPGTITAIPAASFILKEAIFPGMISKTLEAPVFKLFGKISFSMYLLHLGVVKHKDFLLIKYADYGNYVLPIFIFSITIISYLYWYFVEKSIQKYTALLCQKIKSYDAQDATKLKYEMVNSEKV